MMTDPIADMLTRIRNALKAKHESVEFPTSRMKIEILKILKSNGYIRNFSVKGYGKKGSPRRKIRVLLKYAESGAPSISYLKRISKPGRRVYVSKDELPRVLGGMGLSVISTSQGVMTSSSARKRNLGGEVICNIW